ncbi:MAG: hypothetical protein RLZZ29_787 [Cyanobacteriota bacterium]
MKNCEIIRKESGLFVLRHYYGFPQRMISDIELAVDIATAKQMLGDWLDRVSLDAIPEARRQELIDSISDNSPIQKASGGLVADSSDRRRMMLDSPNYPIISSSLIGYKY